MTLVARVNYDSIAPGYDSQPMRAKSADPYLRQYLAEHPERSDSMSILDLCCGTGSQLIANRTFCPTARMVGLDLFDGMLRQARRKAPDLLWVQADAARPPLTDGSFDFISNQFAFHHIRDKPAALCSVWRLLRPGGRWVMVNICPEAMPGWLYYRFFPAAWQLDRRDFMTQDEIVRHLERIGFVRIVAERHRLDGAQDLGELLRAAQRRDGCSQLIALSDANYEAGLAELQAVIGRADGLPVQMHNEFCLLTLRADRP